MAKWTERSVYWGIGDDDKNVAEAQVVYSENLDLTTSSDFYTISQEPNISQVTTDKITAIFEANNTVFFCDADNNLYRDWIATPVWTAKRIVTTWVTIDYLYLIDSAEDIHRILLTHVTQANWSTFVTTTDTSINTTAADIFVATNQGVTYIWAGKKVYRVNNLTGVVESANTFDIDSNVVWLSLVESRVEIFTENWNYTIWDWVAGGSFRTKYLGIKIWLVRNIGNANYIISGGSIYLLRWYDLEQISYDTYSDLLQSTKYNISAIEPWIISFQEGIFYVGVSGSPGGLVTPWSEFNFGNDAILTFGRKKSSSPNARNLFISKLPNWRIIKEVTYVFARSQPTNSFGKVLYFGYRDDLWAYWVATISLSDAWGNVGENGLIVYKEFDWGKKEQQKSLLEVAIRADFGNTDSALYLSTIDTNGDLQWAGWTKEGSKLTSADVSPDWLARFIFPETTFFGYAPALILEQEWSYKRKNSLKVYSLTYKYEEIRSL